MRGLRWLRARSSAGTGSAGAATGREDTVDERYYLASQWQLIWRKFRKHRLAMISSMLLILFYLSALFADFVAPYDPAQRSAYRYVEPQTFYLFSDHHAGPHVFGLERYNDPETLRIRYRVDETQVLPVRFFVRGYEYTILGLITTDIHLFGVEDGPMFLFGTDELGRDLFSRVFSALRISLFVGLVGVLLSFIIGVILGGISGYFGGVADIIIQRLIDFILSVPTIPLWMALSAALPPHWPSTTVFFGITIILSLIGWGGVARIVRGKFLELREEDYVTAAVVAGATNRRIIFRHLVPAFASYLIVQLTLSIPQFILGETALSFLGLGIRSPAVSLGTLLENAQHVRVVSLYPWLLIPAIFLIVVVLAFNFLGDGLRDSVDPYKQ